MFFSLISSPLSERDALKDHPPLFNYSGEVSIIFLEGPCGRNTPKVLGLVRAAFRSFSTRSVLDSATNIS